MEYREFIFSYTGKRHFSLSEDSISIGVNEEHADITLLLRDLEPECRMVQQWTPAFFVGLGGLVVALVLFVCGHVAPAVIIVATSPLVLVSSCRKVEHAIFKNAAGVDAISIARSGPDRLSFNLFVDEVSRRIRQAMDEKGDHVD